MLLHVEVVVAWKVGMQNEFLDFVVLCIKKDVLEHQSAKDQNPKLKLYLTMPMVK